MIDFATGIEIEECPNCGSRAIAKFDTNAWECHDCGQDFEPVARPTHYTVAVYLVELAYGGPEEGGWWYQCGELVRQMRTFKSEERASLYCMRLNELLKVTLNKGRRPISSVASNGRYNAEVMNGRCAPAGIPERRPHYE
jgi:hypothetical protein